MNSAQGNLNALAELSIQVRQSTVKLLQVPQHSWLRWVPPGTANHILWHAGHALWLQDLFTVLPLLGRTELPDGWTAKFGQHSKPATIKDWPEASEVEKLLTKQLYLITNLLADNSEAIWRDRMKLTPEVGCGLLEGMIHGWHDEARHQGEMYLLHKLCRVNLSS